MAHQPLDRDEVRRLIGGLAFGGAPRRARIGLELEWLTVPRGDPARRPSVAEVRAAVEGAGPLPHDATTSVEPGAQVEVDTRPTGSVDAAIEHGIRAGATTRARLGAHGLAPVALGLDPLREPCNLLDVPRYRAMEAVFRRQGGGHGLRMMANTAALQVNVDLDPDGRRWRLANALGPTLVACFANSALVDGRPSGWRSARMATWLRVDPSRTRPVPITGDPVGAWVDYALGADVLLIERDGEPTVPSEPLPFGRWMADGHPSGGPTVADLEAHLTTLFPPVRPRGWLELRYLDALDDDRWPVVVALLAGLLHDRVAERSLAVVAPTARAWRMAARHGPAARPLFRAASACATLAVEGLAAQGAGRDTIDRVRQWAEGDLRARRCPADDAIDRWRADGTVWPPAALGGDARPRAHVGAGA